MGFSNEQAVGVCLGFPCLLKREEVGLRAEFNALLDELKRVFVDFDLGGYFVGNVDVWFEVCMKIRFFYELGVPKGAIGDSIGKSYVVFTDYSEEILVEKMEFFGKLGVGKLDVGLLLLSNPDILSINLDDRVVSVSGFLNHFGMRKEDLEVLLERYSYVFDRNKMFNLPHVLRAMDLHEWFFHKLEGEYQLLANYELSSLDEGEDKSYVKNLEEIKHVRTYGYALCKLNFFHGIGFGENGFTMKLLKDVYGSGSGLQERFDLLHNEGIELSKFANTPKILNQKADSLKQKINFLRHEVGFIFGVPGDISSLFDV